MKIKINVSIGVAGLEDEVLDVDNLFRNADEALYCAKQEGRNRIAVYPHCRRPVEHAARKPD